MIIHYYSSSDNHSLLFNALLTTVQHFINFISPTLLATRYPIEASMALWSGSQWLYGALFIFIPQNTRQRGCARSNVNSDWSLSLLTAKTQPTCHILHLQFTHLTCSPNLWRSNYVLNGWCIFTYARIAYWLFHFLLLFILGYSNPSFIAAL